MKKYFVCNIRSQTRQIQVNEGFNLIISDTVGFIQKLPTTLVAAFKSTLEEAKGADVLMHVVDASHSEYRTQIDTVNQIINDLDMDHIPQVVILIKDLCNEQMDVPVSKSAHVLYLVVMKMINKR